MALDVYIFQTWAIENTWEILNEEHYSRLFLLNEILESLAISFQTLIWNQEKIFLTRLNAFIV